MLTATHLSGTDVVRLEYDDGLDEASMRAARLTIEQVIAERGRVRLLAHIGRMGRITIGGLREDLRQFGQIDSIDRVALVTDTTWIRMAAKAQSKVFGFELRVYRSAAAEEALDWIAA